MAGEIIHRLAEPIPVTRRVGGEVHEEQLTEVTVHPITRAKDLRCLDGVTGKIEAGIALLAHCCRLPVAAADELSLEDFVALSEIVEGFLPAGLKTGATP